MKLKDILLLAVAAIAVVAIFYVVVLVSAYASTEIAPWAGVTFIVAFCAVALLIIAIIKKETDGMDRN